MIGVNEIRQCWLPRIGAVVLLLSFFIATLLSTAHQIDFNRHNLSSGYELAQQDLSEPVGTKGTEIATIASCATGLICHVQLALITELAIIDEAAFLTGLWRPDPGEILVGQVVEVVTPPPLLVRA